MATGRTAVAGGVTVTRFSTGSQPATDSVGLWEQFNAEQFVSMSFRVVDGDELNVDAAIAVAGSVHLLGLRSNSLMVERSTALIGACPADAVMFCFSLGSRPFFHHAGQTLVARPGSVMVVDADQPFVMGFSRPSDGFVLGMSRASFAEATCGPARPLPRLLDVSYNPGALALHRLNARMMSGDDLGDASEDTYLSLVTDMLSGRQSSAGRYLAAARAYVRLHLDDPNLGASQIAAAVGISERHLSRIFSDAGTSVPRHLRDQRLDMAYRHLVEASPGITVGEVAMRCGFASVRHFSRVFSERFGQYASEVLRHALAAKSDGP